MRLTHELFTLYVEYFPFKDIIAMGRMLDIANMLRSYYPNVKSMRLGAWGYYEIYTYEGGIKW
jgi:hypothetical protein